MNKLVTFEKAKPVTQQPGEGNKENVKTVKPEEKQVNTSSLLMIVWSIDMNI